ncbi:MAG: DUF1638 domain-containing protein [Anaerofustis sp.]
MKQILIGCEILKKELIRIIEQDHLTMDMIWLDEDLHNHPEKLKIELQKTIDGLVGYEEAILSFGLCGNALLGITATTCDLIYPIVEDCIFAMLSGSCNLKALRKDSIFTGESWLTTRNPFAKEYQRTVDKYGEDTAKMIFDMMYEHYNNAVYMQTEKEIDPQLRKQAEEMAEKLNLTLRYEPASTELYRRLLHVKEDKDIRRLKKGDTIKFDDFN